MACNEGNQVMWTDFYEVASELDAMAELLELADWIKLTENMSYPFVFADLIPATFWQTFTVIVNPVDEGDPPEPPNVVDKFAATNSSGAPFDSLNNYPNPEALINFAELDELYFLADADTCWCKTLFRVVLKPGPFAEFYLEEVGTVEEDEGEFLLRPEISCCQSIPVPDLGDPLGYNQKFIPAAYAIQWAILEQIPDAGPVLFRPAKKCRTAPDTSGINFKLERFGTAEEDPENPGVFLPVDYYMTMATRKMTGKFTWPIARRYMFKLLTDINQMMLLSSAQASMVYAGAHFTEHEGGSPAAHWYYNAEGCGFPWEAMCLTRKVGMELDDQKAGSLCCNCNENGSPFDTWDPEYTPTWLGSGNWHQPGFITDWNSDGPDWCGIETCDGTPVEFAGAGIKVYCETLRVMREMIAAMPSYTTPTGGRTCCCGSGSFPQCCIYSNAMSGTLYMTAEEIPSVVPTISNDCSLSFYSDYVECVGHLTGGIETPYGRCSLTGTVNGEDVDDAVLENFYGPESAIEITWDLDYYAASAGCPPEAQVCCAPPLGALDVP